MSTAEQQNAYFLHLYKLGLIPLYVSLVSIVWVLYDYFDTLEDEVRYIWSQKPSIGRFIFFWIRYYTIFLVLFDVTQIHLFARPGFTTDSLCVAIDPISRVLGALSLWSIEIIMQIRIYVLLDRSRKIAFFNATLFVISIGFFLWIMVSDAMRRKTMIATAVHLPLPGCPVINGGSQWALWIPPTLFETVLFAFALYKAGRSATARIRLQQRVSLATFLIHDHILYFFRYSGFPFYELLGRVLIVASVFLLLLLNNLMVVGATRIPWFGFGPFHAALGILTSRALIHLRKFARESFGEDLSSPKFQRDEEMAPGPGQTLRFFHSENTGMTSQRIDLESYATECTEVLAKSGETPSKAGPSRAGSTIC